MADEFEKVEIRVTTNELDAPVTLFKNYDGTATVYRTDGVEHDRPWYFQQHFPHAIVLVDGVLCDFDMQRQRGIN